MSWIENIADQVNSAFEGTRAPLTDVPTMLISLGTKDRPGLSAISVASSIIQRLPEAGIETGVNPDGSENMIGQFVRLIVEEIIKEIKENGLLSIAIAPGSITSEGVGEGAAGPITVISNNINFVGGVGVLQ